MNAVAPRGRVSACRLAWLGIAALAACSSVASVNEKAMLAGPDLPAAPGPMDASRMMRPAQTEYRIGARDLLELEIYELEEPNKSKQLKTRVSQDGSILVPLIGSVPAAGMTAGEVQQQIVQRLERDFIQHPNVTVVVAEHQARRVTVLGAVQAPGTFRLQENSTTLVDVLALSGGPNEKAGAVVYVVRAGNQLPDVALAEASAGTLSAEPAPLLPRIQKINLDDLIQRGDMSINCVLDDGDVVHVPPAAQFFVMGQVTASGGFPLRGDITLLRAVALAGGLTEFATPSATVLIRTTERGRITIPIDLNEVESGSEKDLLMQADDVLVISESSGSRFMRGLTSFMRGLLTFSYPLR